MTNNIHVRFWHEGCYQKLAEDSDAKRIIDNCFGQMNQYLRQHEEVSPAYDDRAEELIAAITRYIAFSMHPDSDDPAATLVMTGGAPGSN